MADPGIAQKIGPTPFKEPEIIGVIDHAGEIGVFIIDANVQPVLALSIKRRWERRHPTVLASCVPTALVPEVTHAGQHHGKTGFIRGRDDGIVANGTAGLNDRTCAGGGCGQHALRKRKEGV